jgi:hypothetical protein
MAMKITYADLLDGINPSLQEIAKLGFPMSVPISHHIAIAETLTAIAENLTEIEKAGKAFWSTREKILKELCEKDKEGEPKTEIIDGVSSYKFSDKNKVAWETKYNELREEEVEVKLTELEQSHFEGVEGLTPSLLKGILPILK